MNARHLVLIVSMATVFLVGCAPAASAAHTTTLSPLPTPQSYRVRMGPAAVIPMVAADDTQSPQGLFFRASFIGDKLYGAGAANPDQVALYETDLKTGHLRQLGGWRKGIGSIRASERYVVWEQTSDSQEYNEIHVYDLQQDHETTLATHTAWPDISGDIVVWGDVQGYNLSLGQPLEVKNLHGQPSRPRISGHWVIYLDVVNDFAADIYAHNLDSHEDFRIGATPMLGNRIGTVEWYPVISGRNVVYISEDNQLHHYDLELRQDRILPVSVSPELSLNTPMFLALDGDILVYEQGTWMGYDLVSDAAFPIARTSPQDKQGKRTMSTPVLVSKGRLTWQTQVDQAVNLYTAEIVQSP